MYIDRIRIRNYRCFRDATIEFQPGLNVIIGENNAGKTTLLRAIAIVFDRRARSRPTLHDFNRLVEPLDKSPTIIVEVTIRSSKNDTAADRALVASWLTKLDTTWEAQLTYRFFLPEQHNKEFAEAIIGANRDKFFEVIEEFLPKYVSRVYGGNPETLVTADGESLAKFDCQFLDAMRDVESEMFTGSAPLFRQMLEQVLDWGKSVDDRRALRGNFRTNSKSLRDILDGRLDTAKLFELVKATGAADGGAPILHGAISEADLIAALRLFIAQKEFSFPATHNGLGYNNLIYISLVLASLTFRTSVERLGSNAAIFPMLLIEEPEAHLHPALQYKLLAHIVERVSADPQHNRQVFVTTHSTHVTAAARLQPIICLSIATDGTIGVSYPARLYPDTTEGTASRGYVERYLDATKSAMLFAKATLFVEGIAEQLVIPALARMLGQSFDAHHVAVVRVDGLTFKHFLPLFGGGVSADKLPIALGRRVACIIDSDPARSDKYAAKKKRKSCFPFQLNRDAAKFDYYPQSAAVTNLSNFVAARTTIKIFTAAKTFEYDLALANSTEPGIVTAVMDRAEGLKALAAKSDTLPEALKDVLDGDEATNLAIVVNQNDRQRQQFAAIYLRCAEDAKGEHAFALEQHIRSLKAGATVACPEYIQNAIEWITHSAVAAKTS